MGFLGSRWNRSRIKSLIRFLGMCQCGDGFMYMVVDLEARVYFVDLYVGFFLF